MFNEPHYVENPAIYKESSHFHNNPKSTREYCYMKHITMMKRITTIKGITMMKGCTLHQPSNKWGVIPVW